MAPYEVERELTEKSGRYVTHIRVRRTTDEQYPCGYDYTLHYGTVDGETLLRYDNAHERHTPDGVEPVDFPGMSDLIDRFEAEIDDLPP
jgi:hypothetical protein